MRIFLLMILLSSCSKDECPNYGYQSQFKYEINISHTTESGIEVDLSGQDPALLNLIEHATLEAEDCLATTFPDGKIPKPIREASQCWEEEVKLPFNRDCFQVKIPNDWIWSCDGSEQLLPSLAPQELCTAKDLTPDPNCPCRWRAGLQDNRIVVATPNLKLYKDPLVRRMTGCNAVWSTSELANCVKPIIIERTEE